MFESDSTAPYSGTHEVCYCTALPLVNDSPFVAQQASEQDMYHLRWGNKLRCDTYDAADKKLFLGQSIHEEVAGWPHDVETIDPEAVDWNFRDENHNPFSRTLLEKVEEKENSKDGTMEMNGKGNSVPTSYKLFLSSLSTAAMFVASDVL